MDAGLTWSIGTELPKAPPFNNADPPASACLAGADVIHLATNFDGIQYFRGSGSSPITWVSPVIALDIYNVDFDGYDLTSLSCDPALGYVYLCTTEDMQSSTNASTILFARSLDNGATWQLPLRVSSPYCKGPSLVVGTDGTLCVTYVDYALGQVVLRKSTDHGASFLPPVVVSSMLDNLGTIPLGWRLEPTIVGPRNYPYYIFSAFAPNFPALAVDRSPGPTHGNLYVTWAEYAAGTVSPATSNVGHIGHSNTFATAQPVPLDCDLAGFLPTVEFGQGETHVYMFQGTAGQTVWISGSATNGGTTSRLYMELPGGDIPFVTYQLLSDAGAVTAATIFTPPRTGRYFLVLDSDLLSKSYLLQLRSYTPSLSSVARDMRDIVLVRSTDGGSTWSPKVRVNHDPPGADQALPNVAVDAHGDVYVAWYDRRDAAAGDSVQAYASVSGDGGRTFGPDLKLSSRASAWTGPTFDPGGINTPPGALIGDRIAVTAGDDFGVVAWTDLRDWPNRSDVYAARIIQVPTAVEAVSDLGGEPVAGGVRLSWHVNDVRAVAGLRVFRAAEDGIETPLGDADMLPTREGTLVYLDATVEPGRTYNYRLRARAGGQLTWPGPVEVTTPSRITSLVWRAAWPNPFARRTSIKLAVPRVSEGSVRVYDVQGKEVRTLAAGRFEPGERTIEWDGRDASGGVAAPGLYFVAAQVGGEHAQLRVARVP